MADSKWFQVYEPRANARVRFYCFHFAGGNAGVFRTWPRFLPSQIELCAVQLPGRLDRFSEKPIDNLETLSNVLGPEFVNFNSNRPFVMFGYSFGGLISFDLVRWLRRNNHALPQAFFVASREAPSAPIDAPLHGLPNQQFLNKVQDRYQNLPRELMEDREVQDLFLPMLRADFKLFETYSHRSEPPFNFPLIASRGTEDRSVGLENFLKWKNETTGHFAHRDFPGPHFFIEQNRSEFFKFIESHLRPVMG